MLTIWPQTHMHNHRPQSQAMARLKVLLTKAGINFTNCVFNSEEGIEGLGPQPFVSSCIYLAQANRIVNVHVSPHYTIHTLQRTQSHIPFHMCNMPVSFCAR